MVRPSRLSGIGLPSMTLGRPSTAFTTRTASAAAEEEDPDAPVTASLRRHLRSATDAYHATVANAAAAYEVGDLLAALRRLAAHRDLEPPPMPGAGGEEGGGADTAAAVAAANAALHSRIDGYAAEFGRCVAYHQRAAAKGVEGGGKGAPGAPEKQTSWRGDQRLSMVARGGGGADSGGGGGGDGVPAPHEDLPCTGDFVDLSQRIETALMDVDPLYIPMAEDRRGAVGEAAAATTTAAAAPRTTPPTRVGRVRALMTGDLNRDGRVTESERRSCFRGAAAAAALVGMCVALGLLTRDYVRAQRNPAVLLGYTHEGGARALPALTACAGVADLPAFADYPIPAYPGLPLFAVATAWEEGGEGAPPVMTSTLPDAAAGGAHCADRLSRLSPTRQAAAAAAATSAGEVLDTLPSVVLERSAAAPGDGPCYACLTLGAVRPLVVGNPSPRVEGGGPDAEAAADALVAVTVATSRLWGTCRGLVDGGTAAAEALMAREVVRHGPALVAEGTLTLPPGSPPLAEAVVPPRRSAGPAVAAAVGDMLCNVYFFAGHFYPSEAADVAYTLVLPVGAAANATANVEGGWGWVRSGAGPYYDPPALVAVEAGAGGGTAAPQPLGLGAATAASVEIPRWAQVGVELFARPLVALSGGSGGGGGGGIGGMDAGGSLPPLAPAHRVAVLDAGTSSRVLFTRREGPPGTAPAAYPARVVATPVRGTPAGEAAAAAYAHPAAVGYASTWAEVVTVTPTMATTEYFTDFLEYFGLFTGFCFYTVVAWPLTLAVTRRQRREAGRARGGSG